MPIFIIISELIMVLDELVIHPLAFGQATIDALPSDPHDDQPPMESETDDPFIDRVRYPEILFD
jgi:hypothetical protein